MRADAYQTFSRAEWAALRANTPFTLTHDELVALRGMNYSVSLDELAEVYLPLSRLLELHVRAARNLNGVTDTFLGRPFVGRTYVIAIAGSVAVGKSTFARVLQALIARWPATPTVDLVTTDGFLFPLQELERKQLVRRKGFPESYDTRRMVRFLADIKAGVPEVRAPVYSHEAYDIVRDEWQVVRRPDVLIFEGLNVLQPGVVGGPGGRPASVILSDFFDFSIYLDARTADIEAWYVERFLMLQRTAFQKPASYFHHYKDLPQKEAREVGQRIWSEINAVNLRENILPTRERAHIVLSKGGDHAIERVSLRQL
ncbi:pantothenate kinase [Enhydrobacter aerosaccus]|uniref:Pantothenate kinase n=1 Tax=Enhydrobacter aerosaccus TaxID=225324 RepID=A0A1T4P4X5_9HYPH|nr:type I pantothenate kinase [Enhydrobacter aerosaccus]SJZ86563.1 pantothenate kinase [Enhydrobacter aerosaccus]